MKGAPPIPNGERLDGWKSIATFLGRERTTALRWAKDRGLPVHRVPGGHTGSVYALRTELDAWLASNRVDPDSLGDCVAVARLDDVVARAELKKFSHTYAVSAACALCAVIAGWWLFEGALARDNVPVSISAVSFATSSDETTRFARALTADLAHFADASARLAVFEREPGSKPDTQFAVRTEIERAGDKIVAQAQLIAVQNGEVLWSRRFAQSEPALSALREQVAASIVGILQCSFGTLDYEQSKARPADIALLMAICQDFGESNLASAQMRARQLTMTRPDLAVGWAWLAVVQGNMLSADDPALKQKALVNAERAKKIGPDKACTWLALAAVAGRGFTSPDALPFIEKGLELHPDNPYLLAQYSLIQFNLGYLRESVTPALTALRGDPSSLRSRDVAIHRLAFADRLEEARELQAENEKLWPGHTQIAATRAELFPDVSRRAKADPDILRDSEKMVSTSPSLAYQLASIYERKGNRRTALIWLERAPINDTQQQWSQLFSPDAAGLRTDPAFFRKMADLGLVSWWVAHNKWPDFCAEPGLKYDCADEATKLGIIKRNGTVTLARI